jgi:RimJ/RimL family protein N-acetyltransferase
MSLNFNPLNNYILEDEHVLLRQLKESDLEFLLPYAVNEPDTWRFFTIDIKGEQAMTANVHNTLAAMAEGREYAYIVFDKQTGEYAGSTRFYDIQSKFETLQLGFTWYGEKFRGTGLNKHCKFLLLQLAFEELGVKRVEFRADARNEKSIAAMKSIGCVPEGILRSNVPLADGSRRNSIVLSILKEEWENGVKENLKKRL